MENYRDPTNQERFREGIWKDKDLSLIVRKLDQVASRHNLQIFGSHSGSDIEIEIAEGDNTFLRLRINRQQSQTSFGVTISADEESGLI